jgi:SAM-dependent methyltransferase
MDRNSRIDNFEVKRANIRHHDVEAEFFEEAHPEGSSFYEQAKVSKSIAFIVKNSETKDICIDVGCGTGFVTGFELPFYRMVVATDISRRMLEVVRRRLGGEGSLNLVVCDVDFLPFKKGVADLVSVSSVLHHLPRPFTSICEISRVLKKDGFVYITREPSFQRFRRFFDFFDHFIVRRFLSIVRFLHAKPRSVDVDAYVNDLNYTKVDVHYPKGFYVSQLSNALSSDGFDVLSAYSYHWIYPDFSRDWTHNLLTRSNFLVEKFPLSNRFGRYISVIAKKSA